MYTVPTVLASVPSAQRASWQAGGRALQAGQAREDQTWPLHSRRAVFTHTHPRESRKDCTQGLVALADEQAPEGRDDFSLGSFRDSIASLASH